ncbi:MAG: hypothetical protein ACPGYM_03835 [Flavobacteriales bacterium]
MKKLLAILLLCASVTGYGQQSCCATMDYNGDHVVSISDFTLFLSAYGNETPIVLEGNCVACFSSQVFDFDQTGTVDLSDMLTLLSLFGDVDLDNDFIWDSLDGCANNQACNYFVSSAQYCNFNDALGECGGSCLLDFDQDGLCDTEDNCTDLTACNFSVHSSESCIFSDAVGVCGGTCALDVDQDGICDDVDSCTDVFACNYTAPAPSGCWYLDGSGLCGGETVPAQFYGDSSVVLLLDFSGEVIDHSPAPVPLETHNMGLITDRNGNSARALGPLDQSYGYVGTRLELQEAVRLLNSDSAWTISFWFEAPWSNPTPPSPHFFGNFLQGEASIYHGVSGNPSSTSSHIGAAYSSWNGSDINFNNGWHNIELPFSGTEFNQESVFNQFPLNFWNHVAVVKEIQVLKFYLNGTLALTLNPPNSVEENYSYADGESWSSSDIIVTSIRGCTLDGWSDVSELPIRGIDDVLILNRAASPTDIFFLSQ